MTETLPAIRKTLSVPLRPDRAFDLFTVGIAEWWPGDSHSLSASEGKVPLDLSLEPHRDGRILEIRHDGATAEWGRITDWQPGRRIGVDWYVGRSPDQATQFDVVFSARADGCMVELIHTGFERLGIAGEAAAARYDEGWDLVLGDCFLGACEERA